MMSGATLTDDCFELLININNGVVNATARDILVTIGLDAAGGSSFTDFISHLLGSCSANYTATQPGQTGVWYRFPIFVKAGTSIGAKASVNNATVGTVNCHVVAHCRPENTRGLKYGTFVDTYGANTAASNGTGVTEGQGSEGTYVALSSTLTRPIWGLEFGVGINNSNMAAATRHVDVAIGSASAKKIAILNGVVITGAAETLGKSQSFTPALASIGDIIYGRCQTSSTSDASLSMIAYGVGG
jgi:hypothetical protein